MKKEQLKNQLTEEKLKDLIGKSTLHANIIKDLIEESEDYGGGTILHNLKSKCYEVMKYGGRNGAIIKLIYEQDAIDFYDKFSTEIQMLLHKVGEDKIKSKLAIAAYEQVASEVYNILNKVS